MEPLRFFIAKVRLWHVLATVVFALMFVIVTQLIDYQANASADFLLPALFSLVAIPVMFFTLAFLAFASLTRKFAASALFPSFFIVFTAFTALATAGFALEEPDHPVLFSIFAGLFLSLVMSGMVCVMIAIQRRDR